MTSLAFKWSIQDPILFPAEFIDSARYLRVPYRQRLHIEAGQWVKVLGWVTERMSI